MAKNKLKKFAEMEILPNVFQPKYKEVFQNDFYLKGNWNKQIFQNDNPIILEVGCGKGEYTVELGKLYPDKNFIGLDVKGARMWHGAKYAYENKITRIAFIRAYAEMLESLFAPGEISEIWITFPDPQMNKARKRLTGTRFLNLYKKFLKNDGIIHLKTDSPFLYTYTTELIRQNQLKEFVNTDDLYGSGWQDPILSIKTAYEQQWLTRGKKIKYIKFSLTDNEVLSEPEGEFEKDDYRSELQFMKSL